MAANTRPTPAKSTPAKAAPAKAQGSAPAPAKEAPKPRGQKQTAEVVAPATAVKPEEVAELFWASDVNEPTKAAQDQIAAILELAGMTETHRLNVEVRGDRIRMACACGRHSYFAPITERTKDGKPVVPAQVQEALVRHTKRALGKALRHIKGDEKLAKKLVELLPKKDAEAPAEETAEKVVDKATANA